LILEDVVCDVDGALCERRRSVQFGQLIDKVITACRIIESLKSLEVRGAQQTHRDVLK
jgi:hypothetical protein